MSFRNYLLGSRPLGLGLEMSTQCASHHKDPMKTTKSTTTKVALSSFYGFDVLTLLREDVPQGSPCPRRAADWPFPRTSLHVQVSVKVTSMLRYSVTSLLSCRMSGWEEQSRPTQSTHVHHEGSMIRFTANAFFTFSFFRCWQQTHSMSLICLSQGMVRSLESAKDTYQT